MQNAVEMIKLELSCYFVPPSMVMSLGKSRSAVQSTATLNFFSKLGKVDR